MISAVILTKNEEKNIIDCLESIRWVDEVIIVDDYSEDRTLEAAKTLKIRDLMIFKRALNNDFSAQRNFALSKSGHEWVLFLDADERIPNDLRDEINSRLIDEKNKPSHDGFLIKRSDVMWARMLKHGETGNIKLLRLGKKNAGKWEGRVHESWHVTGNIPELETPIIHYPHPTVSAFLREINFYTTLRAKELYDSKVTVKWYDIILYPKGKFIVNYLFKLGFLDGMEGLIFAIIMSFHSFMVRGKLWQLWQEQST